MQSRHHRTHLYPGVGDHPPEQRGGGGTQVSQSIHTISQNPPGAPADAVTGPTADTAVAFEVDEPAEDWQNFANCLGVDPDLFFPERGASTKEAKAVCQACVVREDCLEYALENSEKFGIWGGLSERERRRLRRARALARASAAETRTA